MTNSVYDDESRLIANGNKTYTYNGEPLCGRGEQL